MIYLTSFKRSRDLPDKVAVFSAAVYQPRGFEFEKAEWADIRQEDGTWIRPREFLSEENPLRSYRDALYSHYEGRRGEIRRWLNDHPGDIALTCWCPYDRAAQAQLEEFGSFVCHLTVIGEVLSSEFNRDVWTDRDRIQAAVLR